jgi:endonuclease YncB( thermonuclease family)
MKIIGLAIAVIGLAALTAGIVAGGKTLGSTPDGTDTPIEIEDIPLDALEEDAETGAAPSDETVTVAAVPAPALSIDEPAKPEPMLVEPAAPEPVATEAAKPDPASVPSELTASVELENVTPKLTAPPRPVSPSIIAPPEVDPQSLERIDPRQPLSELALAMPPKPEMPDDWEGTPLHRPVVNESGRFQSMGYTVAIAGIESIPADTMCDYEGKSWNCGVRARTAFRSFLRGRSPICAVPPEADREAVMANCRLGKQDIGAWLAANGWARAAANGPYAEAWEKAKADKKGIFGPPPEALPQMGTSSVTVAPADFVSPLDPSEDVVSPATGVEAPAEPITPVLQPEPSE